jgi:signal transduction histidine kinase
MEAATGLNEIQLEKEVIFEKLSGAAEELAFGQGSSARKEYLADYVRGLERLFRQHMKQADGQISHVEAIEGLPASLKSSFEYMGAQTQEYDSTVEAIFTAVEKGGFQLSLDDLDRTDNRQKVLSRNVKAIVQEVWGRVHASVDKSQHRRQQSKETFWFSLLLSAALVLLLFAFKKILEEINRQRQDLEKLNRELDRFVHSVSHDIAGPLTTIVGYGAYLESHYASQLDQKGQDCISGVRKGATRLNVLIKDMLELTKLSRVKNPYTLTSIQQIIDAALANCEFMIQRAGVKIVFEGKMPEIVCDRIKTTVVFSNLISNAVKFVTTAERPVVKIGWKDNPKTYEFFVADNGIGIEPQHHQEIFGIFKRLHSGEEYSGSGVGLAIVKAAVEDQGGSVRLESQKGQGTKFIFTIPKGLKAYRPLF